MVDILSVGLSEIKVAKKGQNLRSSGLGSCIGLVLFDAANDIAGMAHIMLPYSKISRGKSFLPGKFADTAIPELLKQLVTEGASKKNILAKMAGGAEMFRTLSGWTANVGARNIEAVKQILKDYNFQLLSEDVGGNFGRSILFNSMTKDLHIHTVSKGNKVI